MDMRALVLLLGLLIGFGPIAQAQEGSTPFATPLWSVPDSLTHSDSLAIAAIFEHREWLQKQRRLVPDWMDRLLEPFIPHPTSDSTATDCTLPDDAMIAEPSNPMRPTMPVLEASPTLDPDMVMHPCVLVPHASSPRN